MIDKIIDKCYDFNNKRIIMWSAPIEPVLDSPVEFWN